MTYEGLLTLEEAQACDAAGFRRGWTAVYKSTGDQLELTRDLERASYDFLEGKRFSWTVLGFFPKEGHWLPVAAAPRSRHPLDKRMILCCIGNPRREDSIKFAVLSCVDDGGFFAWRPIVRRIV